MAVTILNGNSFYIDVDGTGCEVLPQKCRVKFHKNADFHCGFIITTFEK